MSMGVGRGSGGFAPPGFWKLHQKMVIFLVSSGKKTNCTTFGPLGKISWYPPGKNPSDDHVHVLNQMLWSFTTSAYTARCSPCLPNQTQFLSSDVAGVIHSPACFSMKTTSWAGAIRAKLICVVRACTRVTYAPAGFDQKLLMWLISAPTCTNSFCPNWARLP